VERCKELYISARKLPKLLFIFRNNIILCVMFNARFYRNIIKIIDIKNGKTLLYM
jgi:hypothetical protein